MEAETQLLLRDGAAVVLIKVEEGLSQVVLLQISVAVQACGDELRVIDVSVLVRVHHLNSFLEFFF